MNNVQRSRLRKLIDFLERLEPEDYYHGSFTTYDRHPCGTTHCALGWCPVLFPNEWEGERWPLRQSHSVGSPYNDATKFFGLTAQQSDRIFGATIRTTDKSLATVVCQLQYVLRRESK